MSVALEKRHERTHELVRACDLGAPCACGRNAPLTLRDYADLAWYRYQHWLQRVARVPGEQFDLLELSDASAQVREWRGIWVDLEREIHRLEAACA